MFSEIPEQYSQKQYLRKGMMIDQDNRILPNLNQSIPLSQNSTQMIKKSTKAPRPIASQRIAEARTKIAQMGQSQPKRNFMLENKKKAGQIKSIQANRSQNGSHMGSRYNETQSIKSGS